MIERGFQPGQDRAQPSRRPHILVVDDDLYVREINAGVLIRSGYEVDTAEDALAAWQALHDDRYDLLITDHQMPWVTGLELIQKLRAEAISLPVILTSGAPPTEELNRLPELRIQAVMQKPLHFEELLRAVGEILRTAQGGEGKDSAASQ
jgi:DNA-binding response OmpR family regulator